MALDSTQQMALRLFQQGRDATYIDKLCRQYDGWSRALIRTIEAKEYLESLIIVEEVSELPAGDNWDEADFTRAHQVSLIKAIRKINAQLDDPMIKPELKLEIYKALAQRVQKSPRVLDKIAADTEHNEQIAIFANPADAARLNKYIDENPNG